MTIRIPGGLMAATAMLAMVAVAAMMTKQAPEMFRYLRIEGM